jgi:hypothetical protein
MDPTSNSESARQTTRPDKGSGGIVRNSGELLQNEAVTNALETRRPWSWDDLSVLEALTDFPAAHQHRWLVQQSNVVKERRAAATLIDERLELSKTKWQQLRAAYRRSRKQYESAIDPFRLTNTDIAALRESLAYQQQALETYSVTVRALRQTQNAANKALDDCLKVLSGPPPSHFVEFTYRPTSPAGVLQDLERPVPEESQFAVHSSTDTVATSAPPYAAVLSTDGTTAQAVADMMTANREVPASPAPHDNTMSPNQPALLEKYFQVAAEVQILGERLADHNYEYWDAVAGREYREDQDEILSIPDEEFEKGYHEERTSITQRLDNAIKEADRLYAECENQGIDVEANRMARRDDQDASNNEAEYQQIFEASLDLIPVEAFKNAEVVRGATPESDQETGDVSKANAAVSNWVENIPEDTEIPV